MEIKVTIQADEVLLRLDLLPKRIHAALEAKFASIFAEVTGKLLQGTPGKYLDPKQVMSGTSRQGSLLIGYLEVADKPGVYSILPKNKPMLINWQQQFFAREVHAHPYPRGGPAAERTLVEIKPWIIDQIEDAVIEAL